MCNIFSTRFYLISDFVYQVLELTLREAVLYELYVCFWQNPGVQLLIACSWPGMERTSVVDSEAVV
jgi:hypothetical protein